jgi:hypothetical protein
MSDRPSLSADRWAMADEAEFTQFRSACISDIQRASCSIAAIGRLLHNAIGDDVDGVCRSTLDNWTKQNLAGAIECLGDFIMSRVEDGTPLGEWPLQASIEANHG